MRNRRFPILPLLAILLGFAVASCDGIDDPATGNGPGGEDDSSYAEWLVLHAGDPDAFLDLAGADAVARAEAALAGAPARRLDPRKMAISPSRRTRIR